MYAKWPRYGTIIDQGHKLGITCFPKNLENTGVINSIKEGRCAYLLSCLELHRTFDTTFIPVWPQLQWAALVNFWYTEKLFASSFYCVCLSFYASTQQKPGPRALSFLGYIICLYGHPTFAKVISKERLDGISSKLAQLFTLTHWWTN